MSEAIKPSTATATIITDGPLVIEGQLQLGDEEHTQLSLCRCGKSANKPFCDGSHRENPFDDAAYVEAGAMPADCAEGVVTLTAYRNGPVGFKGSLIFQTMDDEVLCCREKGALCRCGASKNKPFCDASHRDIGFEA
jgi:CDGSH-type Zn-finger protein